MDTKTRKSKSAATQKSAPATASHADPGQENALLRARITELERQLRDERCRLQLAQSDLDTFSYSVSHDLRAPLRTVEGFCRMFIEDYGADLPAQGRSLLDHACEGSRRMSLLIDDLLCLTRFGRGPLTLRPIAMRDMVQRIAQSLQAEAPLRPIELRVSDLPDCQGDAVLLEEAVRHLLANAVKFTRGCTPAVIEVDGRLDGGEIVYSVRDNGAGFNMKYAEKLFGVFQRLHAPGDFEGRGIGLAIVQRIARRHGGKAWAEGEVGKGACFYLSLPLPGLP
jgi:light-regulated signal transduction histidine kinase (bacteriophytochrome)